MLVQYIEVNMWIKRELDYNFLAKEVHRIVEIRAERCANVRMQRFKGPRCCVILKFPIFVLFV